MYTGISYGKRRKCALLVGNFLHSYDYNFETDKFRSSEWFEHFWSEMTSWLNNVPHAQPYERHARTRISRTQHCMGMAECGTLLHVATLNACPDHILPISKRANEIENNGSVYVESAPMFRKAALGNHWLCIYPVPWCLISLTHTQMPSWFENFALCTRSFAIIYLKCCTT